MTTMKRKIGVNAPLATPVDLPRNNNDKNKNDTY